MIKQTIPNINIELNKKTGFIQGFSLEGIKISLKEKICLSSENNKQLQLKFTGLFLNDDYKANENPSVFEEGIVRFLRERGVYNSNLHFCIWTHKDEFALIRIISISFPKEDIFPLIRYKIYTIGDEIRYPKIEVKFTTQVSTTRWLLKNLGKFYRTPPRFSIPGPFISDLRNLVLQFYYKDRPNLVFLHEHSRFQRFKYRLKEQTVELIYLANTSNFKEFDDLLKFDDLAITLEIGEEMRQYDNSHFVIDEKDWITAFAILTTFTSKKEIEFPLNRRARRRAISFSKISFEKCTSSFTPQYYKKERIYYIFCEKNSTKNKQCKIQYKHLLQAKPEDRLEECISYLQEIDKENHPTKFETIFVLKADPQIALTTAPFIRYSLGYPLFESDKIMEKLQLLNVPSKKIYFIGIEPNQNLCKFLEENDYQYKEPSFPKKKDKLLRHIQNEFLIQLTSDILYSNYGYLSEKDKINIEDTIDKISNNSFKNQPLTFKEDIFKERLNLIKEFPNKVKSYIGYLYENNIDENLFFKYNNKLVNSIRSIENLNYVISRTLEIGRLVENIVYRMEGDEYQLCLSTKLEEPHFILYQNKMSLGSLIALSTFATFRCLFLVPLKENTIHHKQIVKKTKNLFKTIKIEGNVITTKRLEYIKKMLDNYGKDLSVIIDSNWTKFISRYIGEHNFEDVKKLSIIKGLGYISLFIESHELYYEVLNFKNKQLGVLFAIGRIPTNDSIECMEIVNHTFKKWIGPRPIWRALSIISLFKNSNSSEIISKITNDFFEIFNKINKNSAFIINPVKSNLSKLMKIIAKFSILLIWCHGNTNTLLLEDTHGIVKKLNLEELSSIKFENPEIVLLNACKTGGLKDVAEKPINVCTTLLNKGFLGVCAPFWIVDIESAADLTLNFLTKYIYGFSIADILRLGRYHDPSHFYETYVYYGDPTYTSGAFYPHEIEEVEQFFKRIREKTYKTSNGMIYKNIMK